MANGILITNGADIPYASPLDFVLDSRLKGGLKVAQPIVINPKTEMTFVSADNYYYGSRSHGMGYVPAVICFQDGKFGVGWQNEALVFNPSVSADANNIYFQVPTSSLLYVFIFGEKVSDS